MKDIVVFWGKPRAGNSPYPFNFGKKNRAYSFLFRQIENRGGKTYFCRGMNNIKSDNRYVCNWVFENGDYKTCNKEVSPTVVLDRSSTPVFPQKGVNNVVNNIEFKLISRNKLKMRDIPSLSKFMSSAIFLDNSKQTLQHINFKLRGAPLVAKPLLGMKGNGVRLIKDSLDIDVLLSSGNQYMIEEFIDTSKGIPGVTNSIHDLRLIIVDGKIAWSAVRTPNNEDFRCNVALGGKIKGVSMDQVPLEIIKMAEEIAHEIYILFDNPIFSIDFGYNKIGSKVFEINDTVGLPLLDLEGAENFYFNLANRLTK